LGQLAMRINHVKSPAISLRQQAQDMVSAAFDMTKGIKVIRYAL